MPKKVRIPTPLRKFTNNDEVVQVNATTMNRAAPKKQFPISLAASLPAEHSCSVANTKLHNNVSVVDFVPASDGVVFSSQDGWVLSP